MGNVQCAALQDDATVLLDDNPSTESDEAVLINAALSHSKDERDFLAAHIEDRPHRVILSADKVTRFFVEQTEAFLKKVSWAGEDAESGIDDDEETDVFSGITDVRSSLYVSSVMAPTDLTSVSASTAVAKNTTQYPKPILPHYKRAVTAMKLREGLHRALSFQTKRKLGKGYVRNNNAPPDNANRLLDLGGLCEALRCFDDPELMEQRERVRALMSIVYLKILPRCAQYTRNQPPDLRPNDPAAGVTTRRYYLTPPTCQPKSILPSQLATAISADGVGPPSHPVVLMATNSDFLDLAITGSLGLVKRPHRPQGTTRLDSWTTKLPERYTLLLNHRSGIPLAVCALKAKSSCSPIVRVYATKCRAYGQDPATTTHHLGLNWAKSVPLYTWAEIVTEGSYPGTVRYSIYMASGPAGIFQGYASYVAIHESSTSPNIRVLGRTGREKSLTGCALISLSRDLNSRGDDVYFRLAVSKGIDPALMLCFTSFVDELWERTMRLQGRKFSDIATIRRPSFI